MDDYLLIDVKKDIKDACLSINTFEEHRKVIPPKDCFQYGYVETYYYGTGLTTREPDEGRETMINLFEWFGINIERLNGKVSAVRVESVDSDLGSIELYWDYDAGIGFMCKFEYNKTHIFNKEELAKKYCENNEARSMKICNAKRGTLIAIFDHRHFKIDDDYLIIRVFEDILGNCVTINNLEQNLSIGGYVETEYHPGPWYNKGLNGKVSAITVEYCEDIESCHFDGF